MLLENPQRKDQIDHFMSLILCLLLIPIGRLLSLSLELLNLRIIPVNFEEFPLLLGSIWFGPFWGLLLGGIGSFLGFFLHPVDSFLPYILIAMLRGFLPGYLANFTGENNRIQSLVIRIGLTQIICSVILTSLFLPQTLFVPLFQKIADEVLLQLFAIPFYGILIFLYRSWDTKKKLLEERGFLEKTLKIPLTGINIIDAKFNLRYVDPYWQKKYGNKDGQKCYEYFFNRSSPCPDCGAIKSLEKKQKTIIQKILSKEDQILELHFSPFQNKAGEWLVSVLEVDITDYKKTEKALQENQEKLKTLFDSMTEMIVLHQLVFDEDGEVINYRITDCNRAFTKITGIAREKAIGELATDVYRTKKPPYLKKYSQVAITGEPEHFETYFPPMKKYFFISVVSTTKNQFATVTNDITSIKEYQQLLAAKNKELEQLVYVASHDLRNPLVNIDGYSREIQYFVEDLKRILASKHPSKEEIANYFSSLLPELDDALKHIRISTQQMDKLFNGLLKLSRSGRSVLTIETLDMNKIIDQVIFSMDFQFKEAGIALKIDSLPPCQGDEVQLIQVFGNLLDNALKFMDPKKPGEITIGGESKGDRSIYVVTDNGIGIAPEHQRNIFELFHRLHPEIKEGDGLGLTMSRQILFRLKGEIWVKSAPGKGSSFYISLPSLIE